MIENVNVSVVFTAYYHQKVEKQKKHQKHQKQNLDKSIPSISHFSLTQIKSMFPYFHFSLIPDYSIFRNVLQG